MNSRPIVVASWNVLAESYVRSEYYPCTAPEILEPARRRAAVLERIGGIDADVLCVQEIEPALFAAALAALAGYEGKYVQKQGKPDGCAIFLRRRPEDPAPTFDELVYDDGTGHVAVAVHAFGISIATTHLKWEPPDAPDEARLGRRELVQLCDRWVDPGAPWILCGDFNAPADSPVLEVAFARGFQDAYAATPNAATCNSNRTAKRIDFVLHTLHFAATPTPLPPIDDVTSLPSESEPSDHLVLKVELRARRAGSRPTFAP